MMAHPTILKILQAEDKRLRTLHNEAWLDKIQRIGDRFMLGIAIALVGVFGCIAFMAIRGY
jgi:hypothetical protein